MSLAAILAAIRQAGQSKEREIEERTEAEIARLIAEAEREAKILQQKARQNASGPAAADQARIIHRANLEAIRIVGDAQQTIVKQALERVQVRLSEFRNRPSYPQLLQHLLAEALTALQGSLGENEQAHVEADPRDRILLEDILCAMDLNLPIAYALATWGGIRATSLDGRIVIDNTLESRLVRATPYLCRFLPTLLEHDLSS